MIIKKINSVVHLYSENGKGTLRKNRPCWAIIFKYEGKTNYFSENRTYISDKNNIAVLPKGCDYEWICTGQGRFFSLEFDTDLPCGEMFTLPVKDSEKILKIFSEIEYVRRAKQSNYKIKCLKLAYELILAVLTHSESEYSLLSKLGKIKPSVDYIAKNYYKNLSNDELAAVSGISTVYFRKIFTGVFGISPISYIHKMRIDRAKEMLKSDYTSITDIAVTVGYNDIYGFSKMFKKIVGISPTVYARKIGEKA